MVQCIIFEQEYMDDDVLEGKATTNNNGATRLVQPNKWAKQPRITSPPSFLARVPFQMVMLATVLGLCFLCNGASAKAADSNPPKMMNFDQLLDHANAQNQVTFKQRYLQQTQWWNPSPSNGKPIILLWPNSFLLQDDLVDSGVTYWAKNLGALVFEIESRFTGNSLPDRATDKLQYDTADQHIQDLVTFIANKTIELNLAQSQARWVLIGSFFEGAYSTWFRSKYPSLAFGSVSISPYLVAMLENQDYDVVYQNYIGPTCAGAIHKTVSDLTTQFQSWNVTQKQAYELKCGCNSTDVKKDQEFFFVIAQLILGNLWQPNVCQSIIAKQSDLDAFAALLLSLLGQSGVPCGAWNIAKDTGEQSFRSSLYLMCSQLGQFQTAPTSGNYLQSSELTLPWYLSVCNKTFSNKLPNQPPVELFNTAHGGGNPNGCNMVFLTSTNDPYRSLGPDAKKVTQASSTNQVITVGCPDPLVNLNVLLSPDVTKSQQCVNTARDSLLATLKKWQSDSVACAVPSSGGGGDDTNVAAIVGPIAAVAGIIVGVIIGGVAVYYLTRAAIFRAKRYAWTKVN